MAARYVRRTRQPKPLDRGVALIEVIVSLLIFLVGVLGVVGLQAKSIQFTVQAEDRSRAALLANDLVAQMWNQQSRTLSDDMFDKWRSRVRSSLPQANASVSNTGDVATITITWKSPRTTRADTGSSRYVTQVAMP